ncbi:L-fucose isomerase [Haemophilus influenzae]|uniref:L-fucose isomerase n=2 Tax=Bacteria TaxID=2 RepID=UPI001C330630|nr:L-fucose isomerase [Haemophilus influenzae]BBF10027.1 hypothetical protein CHBNIV1_03880 [Haemophilus influenzae]
MALATQSNRIKIGIRPTIDGRRMGVRESLETQTIRMAQSVAQLLQTHIRYTDGTFVECVVADSTIGGVAEAAACADKFKRENVGLTITVTPCWCYGSETIDMDPHMPKAIWGFNGTERPGAVYLAAALAGHSQLGLPAFSIYGTEVQEADDTNIPEDVKEKLLRFARAGLAVASIRGKSYLSIGSVSMGIAGSIVNQAFFQEYLGMRNEYVDMMEIKRRLDRKIYDQEEVDLALSWVKQYCKEGVDVNSLENQRNAEEHAELWENVVKMTIITRDLMVGNPKLATLNYAEEALGHNAIAAGFQGQRHWTDHLPNGDFMEAMLNSTYDWNGVRPPYILATENDSLNAIGMLFGHQLTGKAQIFADVRTYWSQDSVERVTGWRPESGFIHLINSGSAALDGTGEHQDAQGNPTLKPAWDVTEEEAKRCLENTRWCPAVHEYFRGGGLSSQFLTKGGIPFTMHRINLIKGLGPVLQIAEGWSIDLPQDVHNKLNQRNGIGQYSFNTLFKLHWLKTHKPDVFQKMAKFVFISSMLTQRLTGQFTTDHTMAGTSMMTNLTSGNWDPSILASLGLSNNHFPPMRYAGEKVGKLRTPLAQKWGLNPVPVISCGHDTQFAVFGSGAGLNQPVLSSGTWEILMARTQHAEPRFEFVSQGLTTEFDAQSNCFNPAVQWVGSGVIEWLGKLLFSDVYGSDHYYTTMIKEGEKAFNAGKRAVNFEGIFSQLGQGNISGLSMFATRGEIYVSALQHMANQLKNGLSVLQQVSHFQAKSLICVGGGSKNVLWNQIRANTLNLPIDVVDIAESTVLGAAMFTFAGVGIYENVNVAQQAMQPTRKRIYPN